MTTPTGLTIERSGRGGFTLIEALVSIAVVGILAAVASTHFRNVVERSRTVVAGNTVETLNQAVNKYVQMHGLDIRDVPPDDESGAEELDILRALQWDDPVDPEPGRPYMRVDYDPPLSGDEDDYRAVWNGDYYELREPGETGAGLRIPFDGSDMGRTVDFGTDFKPLSAY